MSSTSLLRLAVFVLLAAHMQAGPLLRQVLHTKVPPLAMAWQMYSSPGHNLCAVQWLSATEEGYEPIDRLAVLEVREPREMPYNERHQRNLREIRAAAEVLCNKLPGTDVRAAARCGVQRGLRWKYVVDAETPLCTPGWQGVP